METQTPVQIWLSEIQSALDREKGFRKTGKRVTRLKADPAFQADFAKARVEFEAARAAASEATAACPASLARQPW